MMSTFAIRPWGTSLKSTGRAQRHSSSNLPRLSTFKPGTAEVPLLMLNGVGATHELWKSLRRNIDRPTIAFDVQSSHLGTRPSMRTFATFVRDLLDARNVDQVDVLGLSWGGFAAQQLAHDHPGLVRRLVLASTSPGYYSIPARPSSYVALMGHSRSPARAATLSKHLYGGDFMRDPSLIHRLGLLRPMDAKTYRRQMWATLGWSSLPWLRTLRQETLLLHGSDDPVIPYANARLMRGLLPNAGLERVENGGHLYLYTRPQESGRRDLRLPRGFTAVARQGLVGRQVSRSN